MDEPNFESLQEKLRRLKEKGNDFIDKMKKYAELENVLNDNSVGEEEEKKDV